MYFFFFFFFFPDYSPVSPSLLPSLTSSPYNPALAWPSHGSPLPTTQQSPNGSPLPTTQQSPPWTPHTSPQQFWPWSASPSPSPQQDPMLHPTSLSPGAPALLDETPPSSLAPYDTQNLTVIQSDRVLSKGFVDNVNTIILHLLNSLVYKYLEEICYGCQIHHPSQKHHDCVWGVLEYFYETNFDQLTERLWNDRFILAIQTFLTTKGIFVDDTRIQGAADVADRAISGTL